MSCCETRPCVANSATTTSALSTLHSHCSAAARYESFTVDFDDDNNEPQRLGELVPPIVVTALDAAKNDYKLTDLPPQLTFEIVEQPQGQQVRIDESELGRVIENGKVRLEGLKLRGTLAEGKGVGKVKLGWGPAECMYAAYSASRKQIGVRQ